MSSDSRVLKTVFRHGGSWADKYSSEEEPGLGDSLESIPSLSQSPEPGRRGDPDTVLPAERPLEDLRLQLDQLGWAARGAGSGEDSATSSSTPLENEEPDGLEAIEANKDWNSNSGPDEPLLNEEGERWRPLEQDDPITAQCGDSTDQSEFALEPLLLVADLLYWKDTRTSGAVFTGLMASLLCLLHFSVVSVAAYLALLGLCATISLRVYRKVLQAVHRGDGTNPFQAYLDMDLTLTREQTERLSQLIASYVVSTVTQLRHFFLVEDLVDSLKLALLFYILTFVGAVFNGLTLVILGVVALFTVPLLYRQHQAQIDQYVGLVTNQLSHLKAKIRAKIPGTGSKAKAE
ncbi:Reticulon-2 [Cricetulus griseus]|uniref:Reticulon n=1 Tax=Cricetulus griseus TaxID=10029 RepID=G3HPE7_CRIGR|nr:Reticulon-2 [Cricetulus griseus]